MFNDNTLKQIYVEFGIPCDRLVSDPEQMVLFIEEYTARTGHAVKPARLSLHTLNLRKKGEGKGGLPRLLRTYNGRTHRKVS